MAPLSTLMDFESFGQSIGIDTKSMGRLLERRLCRAVEGNAARVVNCFIEEGK
jgi:hypothetical protein